MIDLYRTGTAAARLPVRERPGTKRLYVDQARPDQQRHAGPAFYDFSMRLPSGSSGQGQSVVRVGMAQLKLGGGAGRK